MINKFKDFPDIIGFDNNDNWIWSLSGNDTLQGYRGVNYTF